MDVLIVTALRLARVKNKKKYEKVGILGDALDLSLTGWIESSCR